MEDSEKVVVERNRVHARFTGASWYNHPQTVIIGGAGGIGSWLTLFLARQGHNLHVVDFDTVSETNLGGQLYGTKSIGQPKVEALNTIVFELAEHLISRYNQRFSEESSTTEVMFSCFDNMEARILFFTQWKDLFDQEMERGNPDNLKFLFVDGRLNAETAEFFCVTDEESSKRWLKSWFPDEKLEDAPCTYKVTSHCAAILAGMMTGAMNNFISNSFEGDMRSVPFKTSIWLPTMTITSEE